MLNKKVFFIISFIFELVLGLLKYFRNLCYKGILTPELSVSKVLATHQRIVSLIVLFPLFHFSLSVSHTCCHMLLKCSASL